MHVCIYAHTHILYQCTPNHIFFCKFQTAKLNKQILAWIDKHQLI